jgi:biopolymer transport protein ExbD
MALRRQHSTLSMFSMASMTDVIFLLLIFFMVTSTFVFPSALEVNLPQSSQQTALKPTTRIYIDKDQRMYATQGDENQEGELKALPQDQMEAFLQALHAARPDEFVAVYADESVPYGKLVEVLDRGSKAGVKIVLATKPASGFINNEGAPGAQPKQPAPTPSHTL